MWSSAKSPCLLALLLVLSSCMTVERTPVGREVVDLGSTGRASVQTVEVAQSPNYETPVLTLAFQRSQEVSQMETSRYRTTTQVKTASLLVLMGATFGGVAVWSATKADRQRTQSFSVAGVGLLLAALALRDDTFVMDGNETVRIQKSVPKQTPLVQAPIEVSLDGAPTVVQRTSAAGRLDLDLSNLPGGQTKEPRDVVVAIRTSPTDALQTFTLDSRSWTKPVFLILEGKSGTIYADKKTSSAKLGAFQAGNRLELVATEPSGAWMNVVVPGNRDGKSGWVIASAGTVVWSAKRR